MPGLALRGRPQRQKTSSSHAGQASDSLRLASWATAFAFATGSKKVTQAGATMVNERVLTSDGPALPTLFPSCQVPNPKSSRRAKRCKSFTMTRGPIIWCPNRSSAISFPPKETLPLGVYRDLVLQGSIAGHSPSMVLRFSEQWGWGLACLP